MLDGIAERCYRDGDYDILPMEAGMEKQLQKWEYKGVPVSLDVAVSRLKARREGTTPSVDSIEDVLNQFGAEGWELVSAFIWEIEDEPLVFAVLKRPLVVR